MALTHPQAIRFDPAAIDRLKQKADDLTVALRRKVTLSDVIRIAVEDYLRRNS